MFVSVFELFKIGIGPSSSHTIGPMVAAKHFCTILQRHNIEPITRLSCSLHGSLAFTGRGHGTDRAVILGLTGETAADIDVDTIEAKLARVEQTKMISPPGLKAFSFNPENDIYFNYGPRLPGHANGMRFYAHDVSDRVLIEETYYSIGGGFVMTEGEINVSAASKHQLENTHHLIPYPFANAQEMLLMSQNSSLSIANMKRQNELTSFNEMELDAGLDRIWQEMNSCIERGLHSSGYLPGGLNVRCRAGETYAKLKAEEGKGQIPGYQVVEWLSVYAMAVNEENAKGGKVVTAPTNGAAGVIPATMRYYIDHCSGDHTVGIRVFLLTAAAIGGIIKHNASISGAEVGCQGEVGSASSMAAAGLCAVLGGNDKQVENAAEIALEHHLGMICDPVRGLVQVPCIERNALGAVKAVTAAALALRGDGQHLVSLDACVESMRQIGVDMNVRYKETSTGGLAVNVVEC